jgi:hypothetical protein
MEVMVFKSSVCFRAAFPPDARGIAGAVPNSGNGANLTILSFAAADGVVVNFR